MEEFYTRFIRETMDEAGQVTQWSYQYEEDFNYGYDVIDPWGPGPPPPGHALAEPPGEEKRLTFGDLKNPQQPGGQPPAQPRPAERGRGDDRPAHPLELLDRGPGGPQAGPAPGPGVLPPHRGRTSATGWRRRRSARRHLPGGACGGEHLGRRRAGPGPLPVRPGPWGGRFPGSSGRPCPSSRTPWTGCPPWPPTPSCSTSPRAPRGAAQGGSSMTTPSPGQLLGARYMQDVHKGSRHFATGDTGWEVVSGTKFYGQWLLQGTLLVYDYDRFPRSRCWPSWPRPRPPASWPSRRSTACLLQVGMDRYDLSSITNYAVGGGKAPPPTWPRPSPSRPATSSTRAMPSPRPASSPRPPR